MTTCQYCKIQVGGAHKKCPLCQSKLTGEVERNYFPSQEALKRKSLFYKIQLFIVWIIVIGALFAEFLFKVRLMPGKYLSLPLAMWIIAAEYEIGRMFKRGAGSSRVVTLTVFYCTLMLVITTRYLGGFDIVIRFIVPSVIMATMIANFVLALKDKSSNVTVYLLSNLLIGSLPYIVFAIRDGKVPFLWTFSLFVSVVLFVGAVIFMGRMVLLELRKRFDM